MKKIFTLAIFTLTLGVIMTSAQAYTAFWVGRNCAYGIGYHKHDMYTAINTGLYYCRKHGCVDPKFKGSAHGHGWSAVAVGVSKSSCHYGFALNRKTKQDAEKLAMHHCDRVGPNCKVKSWVFEPSNSHQPNPNHRSPNHQPDSRMDNR